METDGVIDVSFSLSRNTIDSLSHSRDAKRVLQQFLGAIIEKIVETYSNHSRPLEEVVFHTPSMIKNKECPICLETIRLYSRIKSPPCMHGFHSTCMDNVVQYGFHNCPICRASL